LPHLCANCGATLYGNYCSQCGQKKFSRSELTIPHFIKDSFHVLTHFDSKIFVAIILLFLKPGFLTKEFYLGRIARYIKPFTLFLLVNAFFFFIGHGFFNIKDADYTYYVKQFPDTKQVFDNFASSHSLSDQDMADRVNDIKEYYQRLIYFLIIPLFGIGLQLIFIVKRKLFVEHLVHSIHTFTWYVLAQMLVVPLMLALSDIIKIRHDQFENALLGALTFIAFLYNYISVRKIYGENIFLSLVYSILMTALMIYLDAFFSGWVILQLTTLHFR
jgi:hypothetical protein